MTNEKIELYQKSINDIYEFNDKIKSCNKFIKQFEGEVTKKLDIICKHWKVFDGYYVKYDFKLFYVNIYFKSDYFDGFMCSVHYEHLHKIKTFEDLKKYKVGGKK